MWRSLCSALALGARGRGFESHHSDWILTRDLCKTLSSSSGPGRRGCRGLSPRRRKPRTIPQGMEWPHRANAGSNPVERAGSRKGVVTSFHDVVHSFREPQFPRRRVYSPRNVRLASHVEGIACQVGGCLVAAGWFPRKELRGLASFLSPLSQARPALLLGPGVHASVAQSVERRLRKSDAIGSIPVRGSKVRHGLIILGRMSAEGSGGQPRLDARQTPSGTLSREAGGSCEIGTRKKVRT